MQTQLLYRNAKKMVDIVETQIQRKMHSSFSTTTPSQVVQPLCWHRSKSSGISSDILYKDSSKKFAPQAGANFRSLVFAMCAVLVKWFRMKGPDQCFCCSSSDEEDDEESDSESEL